LRTVWSAASGFPCAATAMGRARRKPPALRHAERVSAVLGIAYLNEAMSTTDWTLARRWKTDLTLGDRRVRPRRVIPQRLSNRCIRVGRRLRLASERFADYRERALGALTDSTAPKSITRPNPMSGLVTPACLSERAARHHSRWARRTTADSRRHLKAARYTT
jgi:hypothetical protein